MKNKIRNFRKCRICGGSLFYKSDEHLDSCHCHYCHQREGAIGEQSGVSKKIARELYDAGHSDGTATCSS